MGWNQHARRGNPFRPRRHSSRVPKKTGFNSKFRSLNIEVGGKKSSASRGNTSFGWYCRDLRIECARKRFFLYSLAFVGGARMLAKIGILKKLHIKSTQTILQPSPHYWVSREQRLNMSKLLIIPRNSSDEST